MNLLGEFLDDFEKINNGAIVCWNFFCMKDIMLIFMLKRYY